MIKTLLSLLMLVVLCSGCHNFIEGSIDQSKLYNTKERYGVVLFRGVSFKNSDQMKTFYQADRNTELTERNVINVQAILSSKDYLCYISERRTAQQEKLFTKTPRVVGIFDSKWPTFYPQYFYTLKMLPEGEYRISTMWFSDFKGGTFSITYDKKETSYTFTVKSGQINYLGDFYISSPKEKGGFFSTDYSFDTLILDESDQAKVFMKLYHSDIKLPFVANILKK